MFYILKIRLNKCLSKLKLPIFQCCFILFRREIWSIWKSPSPKCRPCLEHRPHGPLGPETFKLHFHHLRNRDSLSHPSTSRSLKMLHFRRLAPVARRTYASWSTSSVAQVPANESNQTRTPPNVSETNELAKSSEGSFDQALQENVIDAEAMRVAQAPNRRGTWSTSQQARERAMTGPRFEQTFMQDQVCGFWYLMALEGWRNGRDGRGK
jgi:hypothetical protein